MVNFFPYTARKEQKEIMEYVRKAINNGKNLVFEAPAGTGKTASVLAPALEYAVEEDFGILYITRTNSQQKQAIYELKKMAQIQPFNAVAIQGKSNMCLLVENIPSLRGNNDEITRLCSARKRKSIEYLRGRKHINRCIFYENFIIKKERHKLNGVISAEEMMEYGRKNGICAYELNKFYMKKAKVVIAPYIYLFDEFLREKFISWFPYPFDRTILIIDEAHNLPDFAREVMSSSLSAISVKRASNEMEEYNIRDDEIVYLIEILQKIFDEISEKIKFSKTGDIMLGESIENEFEKNGISGREMALMAEKMINYGDIIADLKESQNMLPRSFLRRIGVFLQKWPSFDERWVKVAEDGKIEAYCLDAAIATSILKDFYSTIHMSGTLEPINEYVKSIGIDAMMKKFPSPFPEENMKVLYLDGISTKYYMEDEMLEKIGKEIERICNSCRRNILVFFPSYNILERFLKMGFNIDRNVYVETRKDRQEKIMEKLNYFKEKGGVFLSVIGGRISEGIDFPAREAEVVIIVGIPYPPPSAKQFALQKYYDKKYGNGWKHVVEARAIRRMAQAIGRLIRSENDRGIAIILDERAKRFRKYIKMEKCNDAVKEIKKFFR